MTTVDDAGATRVIRFNTVTGIVMLVVTALGALAWITGALPGGAGVYLVFGLVSGALALLTAASARTDRDDPAGAERRFDRTAVNASAVLVVVSLAVVGGIIVWGLWS